MSKYYAHLRKERKDDRALQDCIEEVVSKLHRVNTSKSKPGMLLGKIQSGKTRAFLGVIARAFDEDYDVALVLTKGTKTLAHQTVRRISRDFKEFISSDQVNVFDVMAMPEKLTQPELRQKIIIVAKKEVNNLKKVLQLVSQTYPQLSKRKFLLIDDEADMASIRFVKKKAQPNYSQGAIAQQLDDLRKKVKKMSFLQVTATPYALYLQPDNYSPKPNEFLFYPKRPAFTSLLPIHKGYVGGDDYFGEFPPSDPRHYLYVDVPAAEQDALRANAGRPVPVNRIWKSAEITFLRESIMTFLVAVVIRQMQQVKQGIGSQKYSMVVHNDTQRVAHDLQSQTVENIGEAFRAAAQNNSAIFKSLFDKSFADLSNSIRANKGIIPSKTKTYKQVKKLLEDGEMVAQRVNSDVELLPLLDPETAELRLRTKVNIFIGGSILDRGITIPNLISFYYGRNPKRMQADTVLQHSRMYGNRDRQDLAVTRLYTSHAVYERLEQIHDLENTLRDAFESGVHNNGVVFISNDGQNSIVPCSPSKVALSDIAVIRPNQFYLPRAFDIHDSNKANKIFSELDSMLKDGNQDKKKLKNETLDHAIELLEMAKSTLAVSTSSKFQWEAMFGLLRYYCNAAKLDSVSMLVETGRRLSKQESGNKSGLSIIGGTGIRDLISSKNRKIPTIIWLRQEGGKARGWSSDRPFWWPVLSAPAAAAPCMFAKSRPK